MSCLRVFHACCFFGIKYFLTLSLLHPPLNLRLQFKGLTPKMPFPFPGIPKLPLVDTLCVYTFIVYLQNCSTTTYLMAKTSLDLGEHRPYKKLGFIHHTTPPTPIEIDAIFKPHSGTESGKDFGNHSGKLSCPGFLPCDCNMSQGLCSL